MSRPAKVVLGSLGAVAGVLIAAAIAFLVVVQTDWFKNQVRERMVSVAERASGGRVEIGRFNYDWHALTAEVSPFILHGTEPASAPPFFRAAKIRVGLRIISAFKKKVDIASLQVDQPQFYIVVAPDGSTNVPKPTLGVSVRKFTQQLLDLKVQRFKVQDGYIEYNSRRIPLDVQGEHLQASLLYDPNGPTYRGDIASNKLRVSARQLREPLMLNLATSLAFQSNSVQILDASLSSSGARLHMQGAVTDLASPRVALSLNASVPVSELKKFVAVPLEPRGEIAFGGQASLETASFRYKLDGKLTARGLGYTYDNVAIHDIAAASHLELSPEKVRLPDLDLSALHGSFRGSADVADFRRVVVAGTAQGFRLRELIELGGRHAGELDGMVSGPVRLNAELARGRVRNLMAQVQLAIAPGKTGPPLEGAVSIAYNQAAGIIEVGSSQLTLGSTQAAVSGVLGRSLTVHVVSRNLNDGLALFPLLGVESPKQAPISLQDSSATFDGTVTGPLLNPRISGKADVGRFQFRQQRLDHLAATMDLDQSSANFRTLTAAQDKMRVEGQGRVSLHDWKVEDSSLISGLLSITGADVQTLAKQSGADLPVSGTLSGIVRVSGSLDAPLASGTLEGTNVAAYGEHADSFRADMTVSANGVEISEGNIRVGPARIAVSGAYNHPAQDWKDGALRFDISTRALTLAQIQHIHDLESGLGGDVHVQANGSAKVVKGTIDLTSLTGELTLRNAVLDGHPYGSLELNASTRLPLLGVSAKVNLGGIQLEGSGEWRMEGDYSGQARVRIPRVPFAALHDLVPGPHERAELPFDGFLQGEATVAGPLNDPAAMKTELTLSTVQLSASPSAAPKGGFQARDLVLRNAGPVRLEATTKAIDIRSASFTARDTSLNASGRLALDTKTPWDLNVAGRVNLSILQIFNPNLLASGASVVSLAVRGPLMEPQIDGRLELQNASLFLRDFPNGVDQANGLILFDRNRATVQKLTAVTGGGTVNFDTGSFVGFRGPTLLYRLQASANNVRYRTPDGISVTLNATMALVGTSDNSVLSGTVRVARAAFNPRTDVGALLASTQTPVSSPSETNEYLRGIQFDVHIESAPSLEVQTSLARNIQAIADLRLRGSPDRPVLLGNVSVSSGEIEFFGNKYTINRGDIRFLNPARIEPTLDMDLETQVRGITADISFAGTLNKLNFSYRSDPPLQASDIVALLAVGRAPSVSSPLAAVQNTDYSYLGTGNNQVLGEALAPSSGTLQKLFGVSHIKIDPQITDVTSIPQAHLTFEQTISSAVTLTYITNLAVVNQQIVRVEWDLNRRWSVVALRDENGAFSVDFLYKKTFK
jgi:translocation and assembly module TamB